MFLKQTGRYLIIPDKGASVISEARKCFGITGAATGVKPASPSPPTALAVAFFIGFEFKLVLTFCDTRKTAKGEISIIGNFVNGMSDSFDSRSASRWRISRCRSISSAFSSAISMNLTKLSLFPFLNRFVKLRTKHFSGPCYFG